jgi:peptidoglycan/LPS O-acetylase OafA/YrhL
MNALTGYVIVVAAILLALAAFAFWRRRGSKRVPLIVYVIGVAVVWAVLLGAMWFLGDIARFQTFALVCLGFALGMLAMYIAMHVYKS